MVPRRVRQGLGPVSTRVLQRLLCKGSTSDVQSLSGG